MIKELKSIIDKQIAEKNKSKDYNVKVGEVVKVVGKKKIVKKSF